MKKIKISSSLVWVLVKSCSVFFVFLVKYSCNVFLIKSKHEKRTNVWIQNAARVTRHVQTCEYRILLSHETHTSVRMQNTALSYETCLSVRMQNAAPSHKTCTSVRMQNAALSHETRTSVRMQNAALGHETRTSVRMQLLVTTHETHSYKRANAEHSFIPCLTHVCSVSVPAGDDSDDRLRELRINKDQICLSVDPRLFTMVHYLPIRTLPQWWLWKLALCTRDICWGTTLKEQDCYGRLIIVGGNKATVSLDTYI